ncbi:MAG: YbgC/FadM family acyl-CoA thioesterase [Rhodospirillales bacterium]|nr:YbgC/FadM family acyl-CoA thioesterase [Rhodospirillales bacterium]
MPPDGRHRYAIRVYYEDTDAGGVVYHANYLRYAERARTEALRAVGIPHAEMVERFGVMFMVRRAELDYLRPARLDDSLVVETEVLALGGATASLRQAVYGPDGLCADITVRLACVRIGAGDHAGACAGIGGNRPGRIPPRWRETLAAMRDAAGHTT